VPTLVHRSTLWLGVIAIMTTLGSSLFVFNPQAIAASTVPTFSHILIVMEENHSYSEVIGSSNAPYLTSLAGQGANFTQSFAITHPSQPNYLAFFSGSTQGITSDSCPHTFTGANLASQLTGIGGTFTGYSESMPNAGYTGCVYNNLYYRKHNPWVNFSNIASSSNQPYTIFPTNYSNLPALSFVIPNIQNDMHDGTIKQGDTWLKNNIDAYVQWAKANNSLLIVTWDEDDSSNGNHIPTIFVGAHVKVGNYSETINHYNVLRTVESSFGLAGLNNAANVNPITDIWQ
jgi:phosphatidylinositol-3-phosphatase